LDTLGSKKWIINKRIIDVVDRLWAGRGRLANLIGEEDVS
jgi:DNA-directed RNA polymerase